MFDVVSVGCMLFDLLLFVLGRVLMTLMVLLMDLICMGCNRLDLSLLMLHDFEWFAVDCCWHLLMLIDVLFDVGWFEFIELILNLFESAWCWLLLVWFYLILVDWYIIFVDFGVILCEFSWCWFDFIWGWLILDLNLCYVKWCWFDFIWLCMIVVWF